MMPDGLESIRDARILVVEDNVTNLTLARDLLLHAGAHVDIAVNGCEAVAAIRDAAAPYDAVLMDLQMPIMDGLEAMKIIRGELAQENLPIIATTANTEKREAQLCLDAGANDCLPKPFHIHDLYAVMIRWIEPTGCAAHPAAKSPAPESDKERFVLPAEIDGIDIASGLARVGKKHSLYAELLADFAVTNGELGAEIDAADGKGDRNRIRFLVHGIRSTAGNIGADALSGAAADVEKAIVDGADDLADCLAGFRTMLDAVITAIQAAGVDVNREPPVPNAAFDSKKAEKLIGKLLDLLDDQDMAARRKFDELTVMLGGRGHDATLSKLTKSMDALEFSKGRRMLARAKKDFLR